MSGGERPTEAGRTVDTQGLEVLDPEECLELLRSEYVGRIAVTADGRPTIRPVNYVLDGHDVLIRTAPGTVLSAATDSRPAAFEVDGTDPLYHTGWSVIIEGELRVVADEEQRRRLERLPLRPWAKEIPRPHWVRLVAERMSGRRIF
ncbi:MAG: pyridoxamine 5'-phosphate oxidase family protein [Nitriliruptorales bacterium]|nr:pyridoxamine 5'-phosphate oxidase family protein [Nitriliruptorales bacterium]